MIKPQVQDLERKVVMITGEGMGSMGTLKGLNRRGVFVQFDGKGNLELVDRKDLHWGPGSKRKDDVPFDIGPFKCEDCGKDVSGKDAHGPNRELSLCPECHTKTVQENSKPEKEVSNGN